MNENVGTVDRTLRMVFGIATFFIGWLGDFGVTSIILMVVGIVLILTGSLSFCPIYKALGKNTVEKPDPRGH